MDCNECSVMNESKVMHAKYVCNVMNASKCHIVCKSYQ